MLALLPLSGVQAKRPPKPPPDAWAQCEADDLAREIVPVDPNAPLPDEAPIEAEANRVESSPTQSVLEGDVRLSRGGQRLRADRITLERSANRALIETPFTYGDPRQAVRGKRADVDLDAETGWFKDADYYLPERKAQGSADEIRVDRGKSGARWGKPPIPPALAAEKTGNCARAK